jgi:aminomethyltransferase
MGQVRVTGPALERSLERALPVDFEGWPAGLQRYTLLLNERGGIEDDLMVTRLEGEVRLVVNASTKEKDLQLLRRLCPSLQFELLDHALVALQGPDAEAVYPEGRGLKFMQVASVSGCLVSRSGYTGEDGFEISVPKDAAESFARRLLKDARVKPVGLGARDTLRLEAGLHLYGQDMNPDTTLLEASLGWAVARSRRTGGAKAGGFPGAEVYLRQARDGVPKKLHGLVGEENVPIRHDSPLLAEDKDVGVVTSGTVSPTLQKPIMLGYVRSGASENLFAVVRGAKRPVKLAKLPFVPKRFKK